MRFGHLGFCWSKQQQYCCIFPSFQTRGPILGEVVRIHWWIWFCSLRIEHASLLCSNCNSCFHWVQVKRAWPLGFRPDAGSKGCWGWMDRWQGDPLLEILVIWGCWQKKKILGMEVHSSHKNLKKGEFHKRLFDTILLDIWQRAEILNIPHWLIMNGNYRNPLI